MSEAHKALDKIQSVLDQLIDPVTGCEWDKEQTPLTLGEYLIEECHEMVDAIRSGKPGHVCDEMGDLLFLLVFTAHRYAQDGHFTLADALHAGADKMTRRHPHIFGDASFANMAEFSKAWEAIKKEEKTRAGETDKSILGSVPVGLPPLTKAYRIQAKAAQAGFTWDEEEEVERQVEAEWLELLDAKASGDPAAQEHELGDMILSLVELGRRLGIKAAQATDLAANRFRSRFRAMEALAAERGQDFKELSLNDKDDLWNEVKAKEKNQQAQPVGQGHSFGTPKELPASAQVPLSDNTSE